MLAADKHVLLCVPDKSSTVHQEAIEYLMSNFCGKVFHDIDNFNNHTLQSDSIIYLCGNIGQTLKEMNNSSNSNAEILVVYQLAYNYDCMSITHLGQVPLNVHGVGVYFRLFFDPQEDYFGSISSEHKFQCLTESNKSGEAFRTGIYLTEVEERKDETKFRLLRCSSNLKGPTDNFRATDRDIVDMANNVSNAFFNGNAKLNHVLAQIYENRTLTSESNSKIEKKAKIKEHSDKTKDMPENGLIAFCTFYRGFKEGFESVLKDVKTANVDQFDYHYKNCSVLTRLRFRLKKSVTDQSMQKQFDVTLYPNSLFIIPLSTNRLYTHEIVPSPLPIDKLPTRLGYVIRCSKTEAVFKDGKTYIAEDGKYIELAEPDEEGVSKLKELYREENLSDKIINYGKFYFSLNNGDYQEPIV